MLILLNKKFKEIKDDFRRIDDAIEHSFFEIERDIKNQVFLTCII